MKIKLLSISAVLLAGLMSMSCGKGVMDDNGDHSSNSAEKKNSLPSPEPANAVTPGAGASNPYPANLGASDSTATASNDFMMQAAQAGLAEVELSRIAQTNAQDPAVKKFAQMMVADHTKANDQVKALASKKGVTLPTAPDAAHQAEIQRVKGLKGADFDAEYIRIMVQDHEKAVGLFQSQAQAGTDAEAKALAAQTLPTLQAHLQAARDIQSKKP